MIGVESESKQPRQHDPASPERSSPSPSRRGFEDMSVASGALVYDDAPKELLTIYAPPGKLGIVIDSPDDGAPVIHDVKDTSPIFEEVRRGDRLVAVDGEDARAMTAVKVSRLIGGRGSSPRKLTLVRDVIT